MQSGRYLKHENRSTIDCSNFVDVDWLSSSGNSFEEELLERSMLTDCYYVVRKCFDWGLDPIYR